MTEFAVSRTVTPKAALTMTEFMLACAIAKWAEFCY
jgi:hypothetical protein